MVTALQQPAPARFPPVLREVAEYPNSFSPLGPGSERIETPRYTLCLGPGSTWNTVQRQRFRLDELDEVLEEVRDHLRERARTKTQWEVGSSAPPGLDPMVIFLCPFPPGFIASALDKKSAIFAARFNSPATALQKP